MTWLWIALGAAALVVLGHVVEARRMAPPVPGALSWAPAGARYGFVTVGTPAGSLRLRRLIAGAGRPILLLHTLRTQLDLFRAVLPDLARDHEVHAIDLPAHGYSEITGAPHDPARFIDAVRGYLDEAGLTDAIVVGESIGGAIGLVLAADDNPHIAGVVAINSYDYGAGRGILRGSLLSWVLFSLPRIPLLGATVWRLRWAGIFAEVIKGSVHDPRTLPGDIVDEMHAVGDRPGHLDAFLSLVAHFPDWETLRRRYPAIALPVTLVYGEHDWSHPWERDANARRIPDCRHETVEGSGHLMSFERPAAVIAAARRMAAEAPARTGRGRAA